MIGLPAHGFVLLSMPKCASTSLVRSLQGKAELVLRVNPRLKHMNCRSFHTLMVPVLQNGGYERTDYELVSLFREPLAWLESWWRYRQRPALAKEDAAKFTGEISFEEFVGRYVDNDPRPGTLRGRPARFIALSEEPRHRRRPALRPRAARGLAALDRPEGRRRTRRPGRQPLQGPAGARAQPHHAGAARRVLRPRARDLRAAAGDGGVGAAARLRPGASDRVAGRPRSDRVVCLGTRHGASAGTRPARAAPAHRLLRADRGM